MKRKWIKSAVLVCSMMISSMFMDFKVSASELNCSVVNDQAVIAEHSHYWIGNNGEMVVADDNMISNDGTSVYCAHSLVAGEFMIHEKKADGGCKATIYDADQCSKCGTIFINSLKYTAEYKVCIH